MKANKLIALFAVAALGLCAQGAFAQGNDDDPPPPMSSYDENEVTDTYNEKVTIEGADGNSAYGSQSGGLSNQPERKERLRVYSGKHDGNNVIYDPR
jgi:hypothetical protein